MLSKLEKFIAKRVLILFCILVILNLIFISEKVNVMFGLFLGLVLGFARFSFLSATISTLLGCNDKIKAVRKTFFRYTLNQAVMLALFIVSIEYSLWIFAGAIAGVLLVPFTIWINAVTEGLGVTHNHFE